MNDFQYTDLIILALIAGFIALRLRNTLGNDVGHKPDYTLGKKQPKQEKAEEYALPEREPTVAEEAKEQEAEREAREAIADPGLMAGVDAIARADASFSITGFLEGAKGAFEWVLNAYKDGDTDTLKQLLSPSIFEEFKTALEAAKNSGEKNETTLVAINHAEIRSAALEKGKARVTVRFLSEQIEVTRDAEGKITDGDPSRVVTVEDLWVFERDVKSRNPNWVIIDT